MIWVIFIILLIVLLVSIGYLLKSIDLQEPIITHRSSHAAPAYLSGGYFFTVGLILTSFLFISNNEIQLIVFGAIAFGMIGIIDDLIEINFKWKLISQILITLIFLYKTDLYLTHLDFGFVTVSVGWGGLIITTMAVLLVVNAFNYFDGLDGLYLFIFLSMIGIQYKILLWGDYNQFYLALVLISGIFLFGNFGLLGLPKQFLGDGGNYILSFLISMLYLQGNQSLNLSNDLNEHLFGLWFFGLLFYEFIAVSFIRLQQKKSIFLPGKDHLHHLLNQKLNHHLTSSLITTGIYVFIALTGYLITIYVVDLSFLFYIILFFTYVIGRSRLHRKSKL